MVIQKIDDINLNSTLGDLPNYNWTVNIQTLGQVVAEEFQKRPNLQRFKRKRILLTNSLNIVDYLKKPFQKPEVIARVENQLTISRLRLSLFDK